MNGYKYKDVLNISEDKNKFPDLSSDYSEEESELKRQLMELYPDISNVDVNVYDKNSIPVSEDDILKSRKMGQVNRELADIESNKIDTENEARRLAISDMLNKYNTNRIPASNPVQDVNIYGEENVNQQIKPLNEFKIDNSQESIENLVQKSRENRLQADKEYDKLDTDKAERWKKIQAYLDSIRGK